MLVPTSTMKAPAPVISVAIPSHAAVPKLPALVSVDNEIKKSREPITTFGSLSGVLNLETSNPKLKNIKGSNHVVQENNPTSPSFSLTKRSPLRENDNSTNPAREKNIIWTMEYIVAGFNFGLNDFFDLVLLRLFFFFAIFAILDRILTNPATLHYTQLSPDIKSGQPKFTFS